MDKRAGKAGTAAAVGRAAVLVSFLALVNQLLALLRDRLLASTFGAGGALDVYFAAFRLPDLLFLILSLGASAFIVIPLLAQQMRQHGEKGVAAYLVRWSILLGIGGLVGSMLMWLTAPAIIPALFPGFSPSQQEMAVQLTRILALQPFLLALTGLWAAAVQWRRAFLIYGIAPILYNLAIVGSIIVAAPRWGVAGVVGGVTAGAFAQAILVGVWVWRSISLGDIQRSVRWLPSWGEIRRVLQLSLPRVAALAVGQGMLFLVAAIGSRFAEGSVASFFLAFGLASVPLSIVAAPYTTAAFPLLASGAAEQKWEHFQQVAGYAARHILWWMLFAMVAFIVVRAQIVRVVYGAGAFDWEDTRLTAAVLAILALALPAQGLILLFARSWYAMQRNLFPFFSALGGAAAGVGGGAFLLWLAETSPSIVAWVAQLLRLGGVSDIRIAFLAIAFTVALLVQAILLLAPLAVRFPIVVREIGFLLLRAVAAAFVAGAAMYGTLNWMASKVAMETGIGIFLQGAIAGIAGIVVYGTVSWLTGVLVVRELLALARRSVGG